MESFVTKVSLIEINPKELLENDVKKIRERIKFLLLKYK